MLPALLERVLKANPLAPGATVNYTALTALGFVFARTPLLKDPMPPTASRGYDIMFTTSSAFGDAAQVPGKLPDLSLLVAQDPTLDWRGLPAQFRGAGVTYDHAVRAIPVLAAPYVLYYRRDIFERDNLSAPQTWEEFTDLAERYHNGRDGLNGACIMSIGCRAESIMLRAIFGSYVQNEGPSQGLFWDAATMEPLFNSEGGEAALTVFRRLRRVGPMAPDAPLCLRRHFIKGECLMALDDGSLFKLANIGGPNMTLMRGKLGVAPMPGSTRVLDRASRKLVPCDSKRCPLAQGVSRGLPVNRPIALGSILFLLNGLSSLGQQLLGYTLAAALVSPSALGIDGLLLEPNELLPMRAADMDLANAPRWVARGYDAGDVTRFLVAYQATTANININTDLKIRLTQNVSDALLAAALAYLNQSTPVEALPAILQQVDSVLAAIAEAQGAAAFADEYRRSLNWVDPRKASSTALTGTPEVAPPPDSDSQRLGLLVGLPVALAVVALVVTVAALYWWRKGARLRARAKALKTFTAAPGPDPDTSLVLTDIEGSTVLWDKMSDVMNLALDTHNRIVRDLIGKHSGYECLTEGDSFVLAFHRSAHALAFCLDLQQALLLAQWPEELLSGSEVLCGDMEGSPVPITMVPARGPPSNGAMTRPWQPPGAGAGGRTKSRHHFSLATTTSASGGGTAGRALTPLVSRAQLSSITSQAHRQDSPLPPSAQQQQLQQPSHHSLEVAAASKAMVTTSSAGASCTSAGAHGFMRDTLSTATATATSASVASMPVRFRSIDGYGAGSAGLERQAPSMLEAVDESADGAAVGDALTAAEKAGAVPGSYSEGWQQQQRLVGDHSWQPPLLLADSVASSQRSVNVPTDLAAAGTGVGGRDGSRTAPPLRERQALLMLPAGPSRNLLGGAPGQDARTGLSSSVEAEVTAGPYQDAVAGASIESQIQSQPAGESYPCSGDGVSRAHRDAPLSSGGGIGSAAASAAATADGSEATAAAPRPAAGPSFTAGGRTPMPRVVSSTSRPHPLLGTQGTAESAASSPVEFTTSAPHAQKRSTSLAHAFKKMHQNQPQQFSPTARLTHQTSPASPYSAHTALGHRIPSLGVALMQSTGQAAVLSSGGGAGTGTASGAGSPRVGPHGSRMRSMTQKAVSVSTWITGFGASAGAGAAPDSIAAATEADVVAGARSSPAERLRFEGLALGTVDKPALQLQPPPHAQSTQFAKPSSVLSFLQDDEAGPAIASGGGGGGGGPGAATIEEMLRAQWVRLGAGGIMSVTMTGITNAYASAPGMIPGASMEAFAEDAALGGSDDGSEALGRERATSPLPRRPASMAAAMGAQARGVSGSGRAFPSADGGQQPYLPSPSPSLRLADDVVPEERLRDMDGSAAAGCATTAPGHVSAASSSRQVSGDWQAAVAGASAGLAGAGAGAGVGTGPARPSLSQLQTDMASTTAVPTTSAGASGPGSGRLLPQRPSWATAGSGRTSARRASLDAGMAAALEPPLPPAPSSGLRPPRSNAGSVWSSGMVAVTTGGGYALGAGASHLPGVTPKTTAAAGGGGWAVTSPLNRAITQPRGKGPPPPSATQQLQPQQQDGSVGGAAAPAAAAGGVVVFRGLRVRVGMSCGVLSESDVLRAPWKNARVQYSGMCMRLAKLVSDAALGGQVLLSESARRALEATMLAAPEELEKVLRKHQPLLAWMGAHRLAPDLPPQQLYQLVSGALLPRLVLLSARPLRTMGVLPPLGGLLAAPARQAAAARLIVSGVATLLAWDAEVTERALALLHRALLDLLVELGERVYVVEGADGWRTDAGVSGLGLSGGGASFQQRSNQHSEYSGASPPHSLKPKRSQRALSPLAQDQLAPAAYAGGAAAVSAPLQPSDVSFHGRQPGRSSAAPTGLGGEGADSDEEGKTSQNLRSQAQLVLDGQEEPPGQAKGQTRVRTAGHGHTSASGACSAPLATVTGNSGRLTVDAALSSGRAYNAVLEAAAPRGKQPAGKAAGSSGKQAAAPCQQPGVFTAVFEDANTAATFMMRALMVMPLLDWPAELLEHPLCEPLDLTQLAGGSGLMDAAMADGAAAGAEAGAGGAKRSSTAAVRRLSAAGMSVLQAAAMAAGRVSLSHARRDAGVPPGTGLMSSSAATAGAGAGGAGSVHGGVTSSGGGGSSQVMSPSRRLAAVLRRAGSGGLPAFNERASCPVSPVGDRSGMFKQPAPKTAVELDGAAAAQPGLAISAGAPLAAPVKVVAAAAGGDGPTSTNSSALEGLDVPAAAAPAPPHGAVAAHSSSGGGGGRMGQLGRTFFAGLRGAGAVVAGDLGGVLPPPGSLGGHIVFRGKAWAVLTALSKRGQIGQVLVNTSAHLQLRPEIAASVKVVRKLD